MIIFVLGYFVMGLLFLILRFFHHIFSKKISCDILIKDFFSLYNYAKKIFLSHTVKIKIILALIAIYTFVVISNKIENIKIFDNFVSAIIFFLMIIIFAPKDESENKKFPVEIFGFIYSILLMYCSAGEFLIEIFSTNNFFHEDIWIYGYGVVLISYLICMTTLSRFMERNLSRIEIIFVGMIMMTVLEFLTYYGIGFLCGMKFYTSDEFWNIFENSSTLEWFSMIINQGIYVASQSQILERNTAEILGNIILNGTDVLTITAVLGYVLQKFMGVDSNGK